MWLGVCFGTVIVGIVMLIFAPTLLFLPFTFFFVMGMAFLGDPKSTNSYRYSYSRRSGGDSSYSGYSVQSDSMDRYYEELESKPGDDFNTIKNNYRRLIKEYHYDTIASRDLPLTLT